MSLSGFFEALGAQGERCGHIDGKSRCGAYIIGEEWHLDEDGMSDAVRARCEAIGYLSSARTAWLAGYRRGYLAGASGEALDNETLNHPLPEELLP